MNPIETHVEGPNLALSFLKVIASVSVCVSEPHIAKKHFLNKEFSYLLYSETEKREEYKKWDSMV